MPPRKQIAPPTRLCVGRNKSPYANYIVADTPLVPLRSRQGVCWRVGDLDAKPSLVINPGQWEFFGFPVLKPGESTEFEFTAKRVGKTKGRKHDQK